ncbi:MAG: hypothetical protein COA79_06060 [Planctomycetota bacterium]|nr:MAG: hypothetical protein COA79_06060 [Planctomycetota bacterium]
MVNSVKQIITNTLNNLGLDAEEYKLCLEELEENFNSLISSARITLNNSDENESYPYMLHTIKGDGGSFGLEVTSQKSMELEQSYQNKSTEVLLSDLNELNVIYQNELKEIRNNL